MKECNHVMGGPTGSRTNRGRMGGDSSSPPFFCMWLLQLSNKGEGKLNYKEKQSRFQGIDILLQREMQCKMSPKYKRKLWGLSLGCLQETGLNPVAMATRDSSDQQAFRSTEAKTVLFSKGKTYLCLPSFAL